MLAIKSPLGPIKVQKIPKTKLPLYHLHHVLQWFLSFKQTKYVGVALLHVKYGPTTKLALLLLLLQEKPVMMYEPLNSVY